LQRAHRHGALLGATSVLALETLTIGIALRRLDRNFLMIITTTKKNVRIVIKYLVRGILNFLEMMEKSFVLTSVYIFIIKKKLVLFARKTFQTRRQLTIARELVKKEKIIALSNV
jgi:hypothetical protein